jgi:GNAT superfamily N-acetyltransferase
MELRKSVLANYAYVRVLYTQHTENGAAVQYVAMCIPAGREVVRGALAPELDETTRHVVLYSGDSVHTLEVGVMESVVPGNQMRVRNESGVKPAQMLVTFSPPVYPYDYVSNTIDIDLSYALTMSALPYESEDSVYMIDSVRADTMESAISLVLEPGQEAFVGTPGESFAYAHFYSEDIPLVLYHRNAIIGFAMYSALDPKLNRITIERFLVDANVQGAGHGRRLFELLLSYLRRRFERLPRAVPIVFVLSVVTTNSRAVQFYTRAGFKEYDRDQGHIRMYWSPSGSDVAAQLYNDLH